MDTQAFLNHLKSLSSYRNQVAHVEHIPPHPAIYGELDKPLHPMLQASLEKSGLSSLYSHQARAINAVRSGKNIMVATPAASGKTLCYNLPVLDAILTQRATTRAMYLFPTKALAQDQMRGLRELTSGWSSEIRFATFDGDTPSEERGEIKRGAHIVITNPDMLHLGILPNHGSWSRLFHRLKYVVLDEVHTYRGVFGSQVSDILRRLRRLCALYGSSPQFICCSATIANPEEHAERLVGLPFEVTTEDGAPHGGRDFIFWNPPFLDRTCGSRRSANTEAVTIFTELMRQGIRSLTFARTRKLTELMYIRSRERLADSNLAERIKPYRGGYLPQERRQIELELFEGELLGVIATTALELGVDIGGLDATVLAGYPGSIASTWQQAGRSGRGLEQALSFLISTDNPLDQYLVRHPDFLFQKGIECALTNPNNPHILGPHLLCAAWESPLSSGDGEFFGEGFTRAAEELEEGGALRRRGDKWYLVPTISYPAENINIRSTSSRCYTVVDASQGNSEIESVDSSTAFSQIHPGAIYLHQGQPYLITELDLNSRIAYAQPTDAPYYTQARELTDVGVLGVNREKKVGGTKAYLGEVEVTNRIVGFKRKMQFSEEVVGEEPLNLPPQLFQTVSLWFDIPDGVESRVLRAGLDFAGGLHAAEHACIGILPLFALCDRNDIGGVSYSSHPDTGRAQIFIYDAHQGGVGICEKGFELTEELWRATLGLISECPCRDGCPSCIQSPKCGNNNQPLDKRAAEMLLEELLKKPEADIVA